MARKPTYVPMVDRAPWACGHYVSWFGEVFPLDALGKHRLHDVRIAVRMADRALIAMRYPPKPLPR